jgi:hypothetical protein
MMQILSPDLETDGQIPETFLFRTRQFACPRNPHCQDVPSPCALLKIAVATSRFSVIFNIPFAGAGKGKRFLPH